MPERVDGMSQGPRKRIDSKMYRRYLQTSSRRGAQQAAKMLREQGFMARASRQKDNKKYPWATYYRSKVNYRKESSNRPRRRKK